jgi:hypothetical protein
MSNCYIKDPVEDGGKSQIPTLKVKEPNRITRKVALNSKKAEVFHKVFFPPKHIDSSIPSDFSYPKPLLPLPSHKQSLNLQAYQGAVLLQGQQSRQNTKHCFAEGSRPYQGSPGGFVLGHSKVRYSHGFLVRIYYSCS